MARGKTLGSESYDRAELQASVDAKISYEHIRMKTVEQLADADKLFEEYFVDTADFIAKKGGLESDFTGAEKVLVENSIYNVVAIGTGVAPVTVTGWVTYELDLDFKAETGLGTLKTMIQNRQEIQNLESELNRYADAQNDYTPA